MHFQGEGFFEFVLFEFFIKYFIILLPVAFLLVKAFRKTLLKNIVLDFVFAGLTYVFVFFILTRDNMDRLDWRVNLGKRRAIVELAKQNKLQNDSGNIYLIPDSLSLFPFKDNRLTVEGTPGSTFTIKFYTDRGLLDHYSAFIYTNDPERLDELNHKAINGGNDHKMEEGWYFIND